MYLAVFARVFLATNRFLCTMVNMNEELVAIETKLAYLEDTVATLNDLVIDQQKQIDRLEAGRKDLERQLGELADSGGEMMPHQKPPHY